MFPEPYSKFPLTICYIWWCIRFHATPSLRLALSFLPAPAPAPRSTGLFSMSASPLLPGKQVHQYHLSRFHIDTLIYNICFSLSDTSFCIIGSRFIHLIRMDSNTVTLWLSNIPLYICTTASFSIHPLIDI